MKGLVGPWALVCRARKALGLEQVKAAHDGREVLMRLSLGDLIEPPLLSRPDVALRVPTLTEALGPLLEWRIGYMVESLGGTHDASLEQGCRSTMEGWLSRGALWVLTLGGEIVSMTGFNAEARGIVQVGGVYTPPRLRSRSYARAAVAGSLKLARDHGAMRSVLFTSEQNLAAQAAYRGIGYRITGDYGLVLY
ncbi:MAG TPA: GNAT family N-acetyltransferase [Polyangiaceae bacterium]|nr:GNAT family N-acetyltransferase [Polyangiaceae bacterium]